jgi:hypothetical protein
MTKKEKILRNKKINRITEDIAVGIHSMLRKACDSHESSFAWQAINNLPNKQGGEDFGEWGRVCHIVAEVIYKKYCRKK